MTVAWSDTFSSLDTTTRWVTVTASSGTVTATGGKAVLYKPTLFGSDKAVLMAKADPITHGTSATITAIVDVSNEGAVDSQHPVLALARKSSAPSSGDSLTDVYFPLRIELYNYSVDGHLYYRFKYVDTGGTAYWYDFGSAAWGTGFDTATDGTGAWKVLPGSDQSQYRYVIECSASSGARFKVQSSDGVTTYDTSAYVAWSSINGSGDYYPSFGAWQYSLTGGGITGTMNVDSIDVALPVVGTAYQRPRPRSLYVR